MCILSRPAAEVVVHSPERRVEFTEVGDMEILVFVVGTVELVEDRRTPRSGRRIGSTAPVHRGRSDRRPLWTGTEVPP
jgi:uncharacterized protein (DUF111 family)